MCDFLMMDVLERHKSVDRLIGNRSQQADHVKSQNLIGDLRILQQSKQDLNLAGTREKVR